jgi:hypothetical protein
VCADFLLGFSWDDPSNLKRLFRDPVSVEPASARSGDTGGHPFDQSDTSQRGNQRRRSFPTNWVRFRKALPASDIRLALESPPQLSISFKNNLLTRNNILALKLLSTGVHEMTRWTDVDRGGPRAVVSGNGAH